MLNFLLIILGIAALFFLFVLISIYKDYRINKKQDKKSKSKQITSSDLRKMRGRSRNVAKPPWIRKQDRFRGNRGKK